MILEQTKRLRILDSYQSNRAAGRPSASRKGVCHDRIGRPSRSQVVFLQNHGEVLPAHPTGLGSDGAGLSLGSSSTLSEDDRRRGARGALSCGHDLAAVDQSPMADAGLVRGPVRRTAGRSERLGAATGER